MTESSTGVGAGDGSEVVSVDRRGDVAVIAIDDGKVNALGFDVVDGLAAAFGAAIDDGAGAVVVAGRPGRFTAGFHLPTMQSDRAMDLMAKGADLALQIVASPAPVVFAVTGHALAMGAVLLCCPDWRVGAAGDFKLGFNEVQIGLPLPPFACRLARDRLTPRALYPATQLAEVYDPEGAVAVGLLDEVVDADDVIAQAEARAQRWAGSLDRGAFAATRRILRGDLLDELRALLS